MRVSTTAASPTVPHGLASLHVNKREKFCIRVLTTRESHIGMCNKHGLMACQPTIWRMMVSILSCPADGRILQGRVMGFERTGSRLQGKQNLTHPQPARPSS